MLVVLGSGLSGPAEVLGAGRRLVPLDTLPFFPPYTAGGHRAQAWSLEHDGAPVLVLGGRVPPLRGADPGRGGPPAAHRIAAGCRTVILTAAAGGIRATWPRVRSGRRGPPEPDRPQPPDRPDRRHGGAYAPRLAPWPWRARPGRLLPGRPTGRLRPTSGAPVRDPGRDPHAAHHRAPTSWACRWPSRRSPPARPVPRCSGWPWSPTRPPRPNATVDAPPSPTVGAAAVPAVAAIVRHVVGSLP